MTIIKKIKEFNKNILGNFFYDYDLKKNNWFGLGGASDFFFKPDSLNELITFIKTFKGDFPIKIIGAGSNILIRDGGFKGAIIKLGKNFSNISKLNETTLICGSSALDRKLSEFAMEQGIEGFEFLSCIPGTIGGAIRMNSGCYSNDISKRLISIQTIDLNGSIKSINSKQINFIYRGSNLPKNEIFLSATFKGKINDKNTIKETIKNLINKKKLSQPFGIKTGGSTFKNPISQTSKKSWQLIKESGCDKYKIGDATISSKHPNFFINRGKASAKDMENLIQKVKDEVCKKTGVNLDLEIEIIGTHK